MESEKQGFLDQTAGLREAKAQLKARSAEISQVLEDTKVCICQVLNATLL